jgi:hypothetical protein
VRLPNWDVALAEWATAQTGRRFVWGETDCVSLVAAGLALVHGSSPWPQPRYRTAEEARRVVPHDGRLGQQLAMLGTRVPPLEVQSADVVVLPADVESGEFCDGLGLVVGTSQVLVTNPEEGVRVVPLAAVRRLLPIEAYRLDGLA